MSGRLSQRNPRNLKSMRVAPTIVAALPAIASHFQASQGIERESRRTFRRRATLSSTRAAARRRRRAADGHSIRLSRRTRDEELRALAVGHGEEVAGGAAGAGQAAP